MASLAMTSFLIAPFDFINKPVTNSYFDQYARDFDIDEGNELPNVNT